MTLARRFPRGRAWLSIAALIGVVVGCSGIYAWWHDGQARKFSKRVGKGQVFHSGRPRFQLLPLKKPAPPEQTAPLEEPASAAAAGYKVLLNLMAREETWLSISSEGKRLFSGVLAANQSKTVEGQGVRHHESR